MESLWRAATGANPNPEDYEGIDYWSNPERTGWLTKQGDYIKTWRRRWFVLKQGKLLWFKDSSVTRASLPRGVISVATCLTVKGAEDVLNKPFAFELSTDRFTESCGCQEGQPGGVDEIRSDQIDVIVRSEKWQIASVKNGRFVGLHCSLVDPD